jgi:hypothetical protein
MLCYVVLCCVSSPLNFGCWLLADGSSSRPAKKAKTETPTPSRVLPERKARGVPQQLFVGDEDFDRMLEESEQEKRDATASSNGTSERSESAAPMEDDESPPPKANGTESKTKATEKVRRSLSADCAAPCS